jgi:hypothetical protein
VAPVSAHTNSHSWRKEKPAATGDLMAQARRSVKRSSIFDSQAPPTAPGPKRIKLDPKEMLAAAVAHSPVAFGRKHPPISTLPVVKARQNLAEEAIGSPPKPATSLVSYVDSDDEL